MILTVIWAIQVNAASTIINLKKYLTQVYVWSCIHSELITLASSAHFDRNFITFDNKTKQDEEELK